MQLTETHIRNNWNTGILCSLDTGTIYGSSISYRHMTEQPRHIESLILCDECRENYFDITHEDDDFGD